MKATHRPPVESRGTVITKESKCSWQVLFWKLWVYSYILDFSEHFFLQKEVYWTQSTTWNQGWGGVTSSLDMGCTFDPMIQVLEGSSQILQRPISSRIFSATEWCMHSAVQHTWDLCDLKHTNRPGALEPYHVMPTDGETFRCCGKRGR